MNSNEEVGNEVLCYSAANVSILSPDFLTEAASPLWLLWQAERRLSFRTHTVRCKVLSNSVIFLSRCALCAPSARGLAEALLAY